MLRERETLWYPCDGPIHITCTNNHKCLACVKVCKCGEICCDHKGNLCPNMETWWCERGSSELQEQWQMGQSHGGHHYYPCMGGSKIEPKTRTEVDQWSDWHEECVHYPCRDYKKQI